mmetsp:Transcript_20875/g.25315  ORF Transcript_20875/g.25315 Transcript_20875/m.25315 type:complete len:488 (+) Transcript_20875:210-1673(+)
MQNVFSVVRRAGVLGLKREVFEAASGSKFYRTFSTAEIDMLQKLLDDAKRRSTAQQEVIEEEGEISSKFNIGTFNAISQLGLKRFPAKKYNIVPLGTDKTVENPHAILLRSFKLGSEHVPASVRAVARCGAGTNNIDVESLTERGIPVFNTPGANANAVKELVICSLLLASRGIVDGIQHVHTIVEEENKDWAVIKKRVETDKKMFVGREVAGKKLGVVGLGHIGASVADTAIALGMEVIGYDPTIDVEAAWRLPGQVLERASTLEEIVTEVDYLTLHVPYMKETHHLINSELLRSMKPGAHIVNFARGELVDTQAMLELYNSGDRTGKYIADFADEFLHDHPKTIIMPHLGASTAEAESNSAEMAANQIIDFIETGSIRNSVNFPTVELPRAGNQARLCIVNKNVPGMLGLITTTLGGMGLNISQHINTSRNDIAYNAVDLEEMPDDAQMSKVQEEIGKLEGVISSRVIEPLIRGPSFFVVNEPEQ